jgi:prevent-host-death family protein
MKTMSASQFKAKCLQTMGQVQARRAEVTITRRGKPLVKVVPIEAEHRKSAAGCLQGVVTVVGDLVAPAALPGEWEE